MNEKTVSKYLSNLEKYFASDSPILQKTAKVFHELDQLEYDLGLIEADETTATKSSWWPIITLIGGNSSAKSKFLSSYFGSDLQLTGLQTATHKFSVQGRSAELKANWYDDTKNGTNIKGILLSRK